MLHQNHHRPFKPRCLCCCCYHWKVSLVEGGTDACQSWPISSSALIAMIMIMLDNHNHGQVPHFLAAHYLGNLHQLQPFYLIIMITLISIILTLIIIILIIISIMVIFIILMMARYLTTLPPSTSAPLQHPPQSFLSTGTLSYGGWTRMLLNSIEILANTVWSVDCVIITTIIVIVIPVMMMIITTHQVWAR